MRNLVKEKMLMKKLNFRISLELLGLWLLKLALALLLAIHKVTQELQILLKNKKMKCHNHMVMHMVVVAVEAIEDEIVIKNKLS